MAATNSTVLMSLIDPDAADAADAGQHSVKCNKSNSIIHIDKTMAARRAPSSDWFEKKKKPNNNKKKKKKKKRERMNEIASLPDGSSGNNWNWHR